MRPSLLNVATAHLPIVGIGNSDEADADRFFGREALVDELVERLTATDANDRFVLVVGGSGSGRSSAVRAGLLPQLRGDDGWTEEIETWTPHASRSLIRGTQS